MIWWSLIWFLPLNFISCLGDNEDLRGTLGGHGWWQSIAEDRTTHHHIMRVEHQGGTLEGNVCRKLLRKAVALGHRLPNEHKVLVAVLQCLNDVVFFTCLGMQLQITAQDCRLQSVKPQAGDQCHFQDLHNLWTCLTVDQTTGSWTRREKEGTWFCNRAGQWKCPSQLPEVGKWL